MLSVVAPTAALGSSEQHDYGRSKFTPLDGRVILSDERPSSSAVYRLPLGARQGPRDWYLIRLHFSLTLERGSGDGTAYVSGSTNGRTSAQVKFDVDGSRGSDTRTRWSSLDLLHGENEQVTTSRRIEVDFKNYLQFAGVRPGLNRITFALEQLDGVDVSRVDILADSGVRMTRREPARLSVQTVGPDETVLGERFELGVRVTNDGGRSARGVIVGVVPQDDGLAMRGESTRRLGRLGTAQRDTFRLESLELGTHRVLVAVRSRASRAVALLDVVVAAPSRSRAWPDPVRTPIGLGLIFIGAVLVARRHGRTSVG